MDRHVNLIMIQKSALISLGENDSFRFEREKRWFTTQVTLQLGQKFFQQDKGWEGLERWKQYGKNSKSSKIVWEEKEGCER